MKTSVTLLFCCLLCNYGIAHGAVAEYKKELKTYQKSIVKERKDIKNIRNKLKNKKKLIKIKKKQERSILKDIYRTERKIDEANQRYQEHQKNLRLVHSKILFLNQSITSNEKEINELKALLAKRILLIYREKSSGFWQTLVTSSSLAEAFSRIKFFHSLAAQNVFLIKQVEKNQIKLVGQKEELAVRKKKAKGLEKASYSTLIQVKHYRKDREKILQKVRRERTSFETAAKELEVAAGRLNRLVKKLEKQAAKIVKRIQKAGRLFAKRKATLPWPVRGRVVKRFGKTKHPRFNTYVYNKGIDIAGTMGQNIFSIAKGYVLFAEWFEGYGRMIILDHGGGYNTVYAHLSAISVTAGEAIEEHQKIGKLGDSGTWKGSELYFEIRKRGRALNPMHWLER